LHLIATLGRWVPERCGWVMLIQHAERSSSEATVPSVTLWGHEISDYIKPFPSAVHSCIRGILFLSTIRMKKLATNPPAKVVGQVQE